MAKDWSVEPGYKHCRALMSVGRRCAGVLGRRRETERHAHRDTQTDGKKTNWGPTNPTKQQKQEE